MLHKTRGIVVRTVNYGESSVVVQVFTEKFGIQSYLINGVKKPKAKMPANLFQPLHLLDMVVYHKPAGNLQRVAEVKASPVLQTLPYDVIKSSIALFLNEVLYKSVKQQSPDEALFAYVFSAVEWLDGEHRGIQNFHLLFLLRLTRYLGFYPAKKVSAGDYFDLQEGVFTAGRPVHGFYLQNEQAALFEKLLALRFDELHLPAITAVNRRELIKSLLDYYALHIEGFGGIRSHHILEEVLG